MKLKWKYDSDNERWLANTDVFYLYVWTTGYSVWSIPEGQSDDEDEGLITVNLNSGLSIDDVKTQLEELILG